MGFTQKWAHARVVQVQQCGLTGFLPWGHKGVCATMTQDWFRRIEAGRLTWLAAKNKTRDAVNWKDKRDRWMDLQKTSQFSQDKRFGWTSKPTDLLSNETHMVVQGRATTGGLFSKEDATTIWDGVQGFQFETTNCFFVLSIFGSKGGHDVGIHLSQVHPTEFEGFELIYDNKTLFDPSQVHFFDANYGEYLLTRSDFPNFLANWGKASLYEKQDVIKSYQVVHVPVWWGKGTAEHPFIHELPDDGDSIDMLTF